MQMLQAPPSRLDIYKASAGSGKTFLLVNNYLRLLLQSETSYREILAVTFTNRATAEMRERILKELRLLATGQSSPHIDILIKNTEGLTEEMLRRHAASVYSNILHDYSRFSVTTIDSFVQKIIRSFAYEIGLDDGFRLQMDTDVVKEDLAERLYLLLDTNKPLRTWVTELAIERLSNGKNWDFKSDMLELANELFKERFSGFDEAMKLLNEESKTEAFKQLRSSVHATMKAFENRQQSLAKEALDLLENNGLDALDFSYGKSGFINHFHKAAKKDFAAPGSRVLTVLDNPEKMPASKLSADRKAAIHSISDRLHQLLRGLVDHYDENIQKYSTAKAIKANLAMLQLMQVFTQQLSDYRSENNVLLISDANVLLRQLSSENDASFIFEKMGSRYRHFLIDEFQDTSNFQWDNFRPLLENALGDGKFNLIVGDVKQSIYRWRSGDWQLLYEQAQKHLGHHIVRTDSLQDNFRSSKHVIDFNNYIFHVLPRRLQQNFAEQMKLAPLDIQGKLEAKGYFNIIEKSYIDSFQKMPVTASLEGHVRLHFMEADEKDAEERRTFEEKVLADLPKKIEQLLVEGNYEPQHLKVLTRNNYEARLVVERLIEYQQQNATIQFDVLSAEALRLESNESILLLLTALRWLANPADTIAKAFINQSLSKSLGENISNHQLYEGNARTDDKIPLPLINDRSTLLNLPMLELVNRLIDLLNLYKTPSSYAYLLAFQDVVLEWVRFGQDGLQAFLQFWEEEGYKKSLPASSGNAVEVMTIHKSKGLGFEVLLLPFCNWEIETDATKNNWLWVQTANSGFHDISTVPVKYKKDLHNSHFAFDYFEEQLMSRMDALNLLYVAFTRAKKQIVAYAPLPEAQKELKIKTVGDLLYDVFSNQVVADNEYIPAVHESFSDNAISHGLINTIDPAQTTQAPHQNAATAEMENTNTLVLDNLVYGRWQHQLRVRPAALQQAEETVSLPRRREALLQTIISKLQRPSELAVLLQQMERQGLMEAEMKKSITAILQRILEHPLLQPWAQGNMQRVGAQNMLITKEFIRRPDLILSGNNQMLVIDFFFSPAPDEMRLQQQVKKYVALLKQMDFTNISGYLFDGLLGDAKTV